MLRENSETDSVGQAGQVTSPPLMRLLPMDRLGPIEIAEGKVFFGVMLPGITPIAGRLFVKIIHADDQFLQKVQPKSFEMTHTVDKDLGDYWSCAVTIAGEKEQGSSWGTKGQYVYRYCFKPSSGDPDIDFLADPFGKQFGVGMLSAITLGYVDYDWEETAPEGGRPREGTKEADWRVPDIRDLVVYELHIKEFAGSVTGVIDRLDYLADLGINCIEIMPPQNVRENANWGYATTGFFGVESEYGTRADFQLLVREAHRRGIACVIDVVYGHVGASFLYCKLYDALNAIAARRGLPPCPNPFVGAYAACKFTPETDFNKSFTRDFFYTVNQYWLEKFHVDGFRYDCTPDFWTGDPLCVGYAALAYQTYGLVKERVGEQYWKRFGDKGSLNLIQCPEELDRPYSIMKDTYSNTTWQDGTMYAAADVVDGKPGAIARLGFALGATGFPEVVTNGDDTIIKRPLQYLENHDQSRMLCRIEMVPPENCQPARNEPGFDLLKEGNRGRWFEEQPYLIGLMTSKGIPFLWQGEEFGENYSVPNIGFGRIRMFRPVHWEYFYTDEGRALVWLTRRLIQVRNAGAQFRRGSHNFFNYEYYTSRGLLLFSRSDETRHSLIALNFTNTDQKVTCQFGRDGDYEEEIFQQAEDTHLNVQAKEDRPITVPRHVGRIWTTIKK